MSNITETQQDLNRQRRLAVQLRLDGGTLAEASQLSGLSNPTIIAAHKAYLEGGWSAVAANPRGRPRGEGRLDDARQQELRGALLNLPAEQFRLAEVLWHHQSANEWLREQGHTLNIRSSQRYLERWGIDAGGLKTAMSDTTDPACQQFMQQARQQALPLYWCDISPLSAHTIYLACSMRRQLYWHACEGKVTVSTYIDFLDRMRRHGGDRIAVVLRGLDIARAPQINEWLEDHAESITAFIPGQTPRKTGDVTVPAKNNIQPPVTLTTPGPATSTLTPETDLSTQQSVSTAPAHAALPKSEMDDMTVQTELKPSTESVTLTHLQRLEAESIHIMREVVAEADNPVMMYSIGKDSAVMLHLAVKAFYPAPPPFPLLHVDTTWKFRAMYEFRDKIAKELGFELLVHTNPDGVAQGVNPFTHGSALHTDIMKTEALKQALSRYNFDVAFGGARRDEEKSRAKERVFSFRTAQHRWEPKNQRPELWHLYNARKVQGESIRAFPLSNWTELDIWQYIHQENIPIVPLYYAAERPVVERDGTLIMVDDDRMPLREGEVPVMRNVRFRTLGCYPLTGAVESTATSLPEIIQEMLLTKTSERQGRMIDHDSAASMEKKKQEGYF